jgi:hypothetical protein
MAIPGWTDDEIRGLYDEIASTLRDGDDFVEVGVAYGQSLIYMADRDWSRGRPNLWAVDMWEEFMGGDNLPPEVFAAMRAYGTPSKAFFAMLQDHLPQDRNVAVHMLQATSVAASRRFTDKSVAAVFIDARHTLECCREDIAAWLPKVRPGGWLAGHDYSDAFPGVKQAANEAFGWANLEVRGSVWIGHRP